MRIKGLKTSPKIRGNTLSDALLKSLDQKFAADAAKKTNALCAVFLQAVIEKNDVHLHFVARNAGCDVVFKGHCRDDVVFKGHCQGDVVFKGHCWCMYRDVAFKGHCQGDVVFKGHCRCMYCDVVFKGHCQGDVVFKGPCWCTLSLRDAVSVCTVTSSLRDTVRVASSLRDTVGVCIVTSSLRNTVRVTSSLRDTVGVCTVTLSLRDTVMGCDISRPDLSGTVSGVSRFGRKHTEMTCRYRGIEPTLSDSCSFLPSQLRYSCRQTHNKNATRTLVGKGGASLAFEVLSEFTTLLHAYLYQEQSI